MLVIGYTGVAGRGSERDQRRAWLWGKLKGGQSYFDRFLSFGEDQEDVPLPYFPLRGLGHDCAASALVDGTVVASAAEERFNRRKHSLGLDGANLLPARAFQYCLETVKAAPSDVDAICHYLDLSPETFARRTAILRAVLPEPLRGRVLRASQLSYEREFGRDRILEQLDEFTGVEWPREKVHFVPHHLAHAASAYYSSGLEEAGVLTLDGAGEIDSSIFALGWGRHLAEIERTSAPNSLGFLYMVLTVFLGFKALDDEYKVMGLAAYGDPRTYREAMGTLLRLGANGDYDTSVLVRPDLRDLLLALFGPPREEDAPVTRREMDIAAALQSRIEEVVITRLDHLRARYHFENLCMAGGVALNCALNGAIARTGLFEKIFVFPAAADDGCSTGAALYVHHNVLGGGHHRRPLSGVYLGPEATEEEIRQELARHADRVSYRRAASIEQEAAQLVAAGKVVAWYQGRMEFGPRALGNRSILGDPRNPAMQEIINERVKWRERFRPFAPAVKAERATEYFDMAGVADSPFMLFVVPVRERHRETLPAITHADGSARVQTVEREQNPRFWKLLDCLEQETGVPVVLNTSFNVKGEPIVATPADALKCVLNTNIDHLVMGDFLVAKKEKGAN